MALVPPQGPKSHGVKFSWTGPSMHYPDHLGEGLSFLETLRWKMEGARHTARFPAVIWFSSAEAMSLRK